MKHQNLSDTSAGYAPTPDQILEFLNTQQLCTFATLADDGRPQAATVAFSEHPNLELIVGTSVSSRKAANIARDGRVAITVTDPDKRYTVQYEGIGQGITQAELAHYEAAHFAKQPGSLPFKDLPDQFYILVKPLFVRFSDCNPYPWRLTEYLYKIT